VNSRTFWRRATRDLDSEFTWELFLRVPEIHIYLVVSGKSLFKCSKAPNGHPRKAGHLRVFWVFGSLQKLYMPYLHGFEESLNNQGIIRKNTIKIQILLVPIFFWMYFSFYKLGKYSSSNLHFGAPGSEEKISRCRQ
jgi:hypothetical protein